MFKIVVFSLQLHPPDADIVESNTRHMLEAKQEARKMNVAVLSVGSFPVVLCMFKTVVFSRMGLSK